VGRTKEDNMNLGRPSIALAAIVLATLQVAVTPAKAEAWFIFPWFSSTPTEKPRVASRIEQAPVQQVAPRAPVVRQTQTRVLEPTPARSVLSQPYIVVGLGG
jgi:hypothetical protein